MSNNTPSPMAGDLGIKVKDSNEVRKKKISQLETTRLGDSSSPTVTPHMYADLCPEIPDTPIGAQSPINLASTPFKPQNHFPFGLKSSDFSENPKPEEESTSGTQPQKNPNPCSPETIFEPSSTPAKEPKSNYSPHSPTKSPSSSRILQEVFRNASERLGREEKISALVQSFEAEMKVMGMALDLSHLTTQLKSLQEEHSMPESSSRFLEGDFVEVEDRPEDSSKDGLVPTQKQGKAPNWASLFKAQAPSKSLKLEHFPEMQNGTEAVVDLQDSDTDTTLWNHCLVGYFLDGKMSFNLLSATARAVWKESAPTSIKQIGSCFFFMFKDETTKLQVLEGGPYFFSRRYLVLTDWRRMLVPNAVNPPSIPAWVKLHKLPLECWTASGFSRIASTIGKPIHVDNATANKRRLDYARVCVEISANDDLPSEVVIRANGDSVVTRVEYQWLPAKCSECRVFGHKCKPKQVPAAPVLGSADEVLGKQPAAAHISNLDPLVQRKVSDALALGGSAALDAVTTSVPFNVASCPSTVSSSGTSVGLNKTSDSETINKKAAHLGNGEDLDPSFTPVSSPEPADKGKLEAGIDVGGDFQLVSNKKKKKGRSNQRAPLHTKGQ